MIIFMQQRKDWKVFLVIAIFFISCISSRYGTLSSYVSAHVADMQCVVLAADALPTDFPIIKENSKRAGLSVTIAEELLCIVVICLLLRRKDTSPRRHTAQAHHNRVLHKYQKSVMARQTVR